MNQALSLAIYFKIDLGFELDQHRVLTQRFCYRVAKIVCGHRSTYQLAHGLDLNLVLFQDRPDFAHQVQCTGCIAMDGDRLKAHF